MTQSRRVFLQALGAGVAIVSLPEISSILNWLSFPGSPDDDLAATLSKLLSGKSAGGTFVARASDTSIIEGEPQRLLGAPSALLKMLDHLELDRSFSDKVDYSDSRQCKEHFELQERTWRQQHGFEAFTDVKRAPADDQVAIAVGGNLDSDHNLIEAAGATQYHDHPAKPIIANDPGLILAAWWLLHKDSSEKELAQRLAVIEKQNLVMDGDQTATRYETPISASVYIPRPRRNSRISNAIGIIAANHKNDPNNIYFADLYK
jgi:hypothetical protein